MDTFNYRTEQGERWDLVAWKMYGTLEGIGILIKENPDVPLDPIFPDGTILHVPIIENTESVSIAVNLPPWKR